METVDEGYGGLVGFTARDAGDDFGGTGGGGGQTELAEPDEREDDVSVSVADVLDVDVEATNSPAAQVVIGVQTRKSPSLDTCLNSQYGSAPLSCRRSDDVVSDSVASLRSHLGKRTEILSLLILIPSSV